MTNCMYAPAATFSSLLRYLIMASLQIYRQRKRRNSKIPSHTISCRPVADGVSRQSPGESQFVRSSLTSVDSDTSKKNNGPIWSH